MEKPRSGINIPDPQHWFKALWRAFNHACVVLIVIRCHADSRVTFLWELFYVTFLCESNADSEISERMNLDHIF
jgi:hypothetical protein